MNKLFILVNSEKKNPDDFFDHKTGREKAFIFFFFPSIKSSLIVVIRLFFA